MRTVAIQRSHQCVSSPVHLHSHWLLTSAHNVRSSSPLSFHSSWSLGSQWIYIYIYLIIYIYRLYIYIYLSIFLLHIDYLHFVSIYTTSYYMKYMNILIINIYIYRYIFDLLVKSDTKGKVLSMRFTKGMATFLWCILLIVFVTFCLHIWISRERMANGGTLRDGKRMVWGKDFFLCAFI